MGALVGGAKVGQTVEKPWVAPLVVLVVVGALWEAAVWLLRVPVFILPAPSAIVTTFVTNAGELFTYGFNTFRQALIGFGIGCGAGMVVGTVRAASLRAAFFFGPAFLASALLALFFPQGFLESLCGYETFVLDEELNSSVHRLHRHSKK